MSDREQLIDDYVATWNEVDGDRRTGLMEQVWVDDAYYSDPAVEAQGREAISDNIDRVHEKFPDRIFCRTSDVFVHRGRARFTWAILDPAGAAIQAGVQYAEFADDGRLRRMVGIFDRTPDWPKLTRPVIRTPEGLPANDSDFSGYSGQKDRFDSDTEVSAVGDGRFTTEVRGGWASIGAQATGGYLLALVLAASSNTVPGLVPLSATVHYLKRSELGPADIDVEVVKRGQLRSTVAATLRQEGAERLRAVATYGDRGALGGRSSSPRDDRRSPRRRTASRRGWTCWATRPASRRGSTTSSTQTPDGRGVPPPGGRKWTVGSGSPTAGRRTCPACR